MTLPMDFAARDPGRTAVIDDHGGTLGYGALDAQAWRLADLVRRSGIGAGEHVALCLENRLEYFWVLFGFHYAGVYYTAISPWLREDEIAYIVENCGARLLIGSAATRPKLAEARAGADKVERWFSIDGGAPGYEDLRPALAECSAAPLDNPREGRDMLYSSGSTGRPKGVKHALARTAFGQEADAARGMFDHFGLSEQSVYLNPAPLYHAAPLRWSMSVLRRGGTVVSMTRFDAARALDLMSRHGVTEAQFVPTMMIRMLKLPEEVRASADLSRLRRVVHAAAPCPADTKRQLIEWWGPIVDEYYGGTEGNGLTYITAGEALKKPGSVGRALAGVLHVLDDDGNGLPAGTPGKVYFSGRPDFEYHGEPEKTAASYRGEKSTLGDIGYVDDDGYLFLTDRDVNLIVTGGTNVYPQLTEDVLTLHPDVMDAAAVGAPDEDLGEVILAVIEPKDPSADRGALVDRLKAHCTVQLPTIRRPKHYDIVDRLPRHPNGKLRKVELREIYRKRLAGGPPGA